MQFDDPHSHEMCVHDGHEYIHDIVVSLRVCLFERKKNNFFNQNKLNDAFFKKVSID